MIDWHKYSRVSNIEDISFSNIEKFVNDNQHLQEIDSVKKNAEKIIMDQNLPYDRIAQYFALNDPTSKESKLYLLKAKIDFFQKSQLSELELEKINKDIHKEISKIWIEENFDKDEEANFLDKYHLQLNEKDHVFRIERLLMDDMISEAKRIIPLLGKDYKKLFNAAVDINYNKKYINNIILSIPRKLRNNEALLYRRALWYKSKNMTEDVIDLLLKTPKDFNFSDKWWSLRNLYSRELLKNKEYKDAYNIIERSNLTKDSPKYWEEQWMSGWIALSFLDKPKNAYKHFSNLYNNVVQPITIARASYWLGRSMEEIGIESDALKWYKEASNYPIYFYGQLAINKYHNLAKKNNQKISINLPEIPNITAQDMLDISNSVDVQIAYLLLKQGKISQSIDLLESIIYNTKSKGQIAIIMKIVNEFSNRSLEVKLARIAAKKDVFFVKDSFQIIDKIKNNHNASLIHAIIRQESGFAKEALSSAGAVGFMQIMPETAKLVTKELDIKYDRKKLSNDIDYNIKIGSYYIKSLVDKFNGSEILAIAAYNAGPNNAYRWIDEFYDPREVGHDIDKIVDWIELITYYETRNYVQRIMENVIVYKYLLTSDKSNP